MDSDNPLRRCTVDDGFSLAAVGDLIAGRALGPVLEREPDMRAAVEIIRGCDVGFGNLETSIFDARTFPGHLQQTNDWALVAPPPAAHDLASFGFNLVSRANNHSMDWGRDGAQITGSLLDEAGIAHAGVGDSLARAGTAGFLETARGRVGLVSLHTTSKDDGAQAMDQFGQIRPRMGFSSLRLRLTVRMPGQSIDRMREVQQRLDPLGQSAVRPAGDPSFDLLGARFDVADDVSATYEPFPEDLVRLRHAVRAGKQYADFLVVSAHVHEEGPDVHTPPAFLVDLARDAIDAGADAFIGHGVHRLWPVEQYRGRPILYGLGNFFLVDLLEPMPPNLYDDARDLIDISTATDHEVNAALSAVAFEDPVFYASVVARLEVTGDAITTTLHPVDLGYGEHITRRGLPFLATGARAKAILNDLRDLSSLSALRIDGDVAILG